MAALLRCMRSAEERHMPRVTLEFCALMYAAAAFRAAYNVPTLAPYEWPQLPEKDASRVLKQRASAAGTLAAPGGPNVAVGVAPPVPPAHVSPAAALQVGGSASAPPHVPSRPAADAT